jgi:hypothetical protein
MGILEEEATSEVMVILGDTEAIKVMEIEEIMEVTEASIEAVLKMTKTSNRHLRNLVQANHKAETTIQIGEIIPMQIEVIVVAQAEDIHPEDVAMETLTEEGEDSGH